MFSNVLIIQKEEEKFVFKKTAFFRLHCWDGELEDRKKRGLEMNLHTLKMMDKGGIHDHISQVYRQTKNAVSKNCHE